MTTRTGIPPTGTSGPLPHLGLLRFAGPDAPSFLQGQLSNDMGRLNAGSPLLAAYSTPQGRVIAVLRLLPHSSGIVALLPRELVAPTQERLRKFVLRAKVRIEDAGDELLVAGVTGAEGLASAELPAPDTDRGYVERNGVGVGRVGHDPSRYWAIGDRSALAAHGLGAQPSSGPGTQPTGGPDAQPTDRRDAQPSSGPATQPVEQAWRLADIRAGLPQVYAATSEMFVAQMLNLDLIDGISFTKGCYTGQEIIARTQHLGRIKRRSFRLRLPAGSWTVGQTVTLTDGRSGRLTELAPVGDGFEALAVLTLEAGAPAESGNTAPGTGVGAGAHTNAANAAIAAIAAIAAPGHDADPSPALRIDAVELPLPYPLA